MALKSNNGSLPWQGNFGHWNPHVITKPFNELEKPTSLQKELAEKYSKTIELLAAIPGSDKAFDGHFPLCPFISPILEKSKTDDINLNKIGGYADLRRSWLWSHSTSHMPAGSQSRLAELNIKGARSKLTKKEQTEQAELHRKYYGEGKDWVAAAERVWPRCGTCHTYMDFVAQFDLTDYWAAIHDLTCTTEYHSSYSGIGICNQDKLLCMEGYMKLHVYWTFFACPDAQGHFYSPNFDAHVWTEQEMVYTDEAMGILRKEKPDPEKVDKRKLLAEETIKAFCDKHQIKQRPVRVIKGLNLGLELDKYDGFFDYKFENRLDKVLEANPDIFGKTRQYKLFGKPESQQEEARFFGPGNRDSMPHRLSPVLCWDDDEHDVTHQMYADVQRPMCEMRTSLPAKMDCSCT